MYIESWWRFSVGDIYASKIWNILENLEAFQKEIRYGYNFRNFEIFSKHLPASVLLLFLSQFQFIPSQSLKKGFLILYGKELGIVS